MDLQHFLGIWNYWIAGLVLFTGLYLILANHNLVKVLIGLGLFQTSVIIFFVSMGYIRGGSEPIIKDGITTYINPLPHVLMLTAIVVGLGTLALGFAIIIRIRKAFGTLDSSEITELCSNKNKENPIKENS